ncbi:MAG: hypothetical protein QOJ13_1345 [Gaiellales bacterium]|nr:hypothetical protein [Gaiellales bacterium]
MASIRSRVRGKQLAGRLMIVLAVLVPVACGSAEEAAGPKPSATPSTDTTTPSTVPLATVDELPQPVANTRSAILAAAAARDYDALAPLVEPRRFLSDFGFGVDPVGPWRDRGTEALKAMETLLNMRHSVKETNEGTLYQWPRFTTDSDPTEISPAEREALLTILDERELEAASLSETGYTGPRIGILADGSWWFFITEIGA